MQYDPYADFQKLQDNIEKQKLKKKALEDKLKSTKYKYENQLDYQKNYKLRKERTHRLVQKGALFEKYIEEHLKDEFEDTLTPQESELLLDVFSDILKKNKPYIIKQWNIKKDAQPKNG